MKFEELMKSLNGIGLSLIKEDTEGVYGVTLPGIANRLLFFDATVRATEYTGGVTVKAINAHLFTGEQIKKALDMVDAFMRTSIIARETPDER